MPGADAGPGVRVRFLVPANQVLHAAKQIEESEAEGWVFDAEPAYLSKASPDPKAFQRSPSGTVVIVSAVVCTECGHENEMKDMEFHPG